jgi:hypothetical protein
MTSLTDTISIKRWQALAMLGLSGFAVGTVLAKIAAALGF